MFLVLTGATVISIGLLISIKEEPPFASRMELREKLVPHKSL